MVPCRNRRGFRRKRERGPSGVTERAAVHESRWAAISSVAEKIGRRAKTLRKWVRQAESGMLASGLGLTTKERERLEQLERENVQPRRANEILRLASAYSPRRSSTAEHK